MDRDQGAREAADSGNPYEWNTPEWHIWNEGCAAGRSEFARMLKAMNDRRRSAPTKVLLGEPFNALPETYGYSPNERFR